MFVFASDFFADDVEFRCRIRGVVEGLAIGTRLLGPHPVHSSSVGEGEEPGQCRPACRIERVHGFPSLEIYLLNSFFGEPRITENSEHHPVDPGAGPIVELGEC
jgi:hypothetical protein